MQIIVKNIEWDTDGQRPNDCGLPVSVTLKPEVVFGKKIEGPMKADEAMMLCTPDAADKVVDYLSDEYEYCIINADISFDFSDNAAECPEAL